jgi:hypothetical protein
LGGMPTSRVAWTSELDVYISSRGASFGGSINLHVIGELRLYWISPILAFLTFVDAATFGREASCPQRALRICGREQCRGRIYLTPTFDGDAKSLKFGLARLQICGFRAGQMVQRNATDSTFLAKAGMLPEVNLWSVSVAKAGRQPRGEIACSRDRHIVSQTLPVWANSWKALRSRSRASCRKLESRKLDCVGRSG